MPALNLSGADGALMQRRDSFAKCPGRVTPHGAPAFFDYSHCMNKKPIFESGKSGIVLGAVLVVTLTGCYETQ
jgi:hypothetical protein